MRLLVPLVPVLAVVVIGCGGEKADSSTAETRSTSSTRSIDKTIDALGKADNRVIEEKVGFKLFPDCEVPAGFESIDLSPSDGKMRQFTALTPKMAKEVIAFYKGMFDGEKIVVDEEMLGQIRGKTKAGHEVIVQAQSHNGMTTINYMITPK
ncbi:MAG: hypothetical protein KIT74_12010 [Fimbriimonadales bacterium]|nr:hypothetical protein [Fimbriimonadales bacterium]